MKIKSHLLNIKKLVKGIVLPFFNFLKAVFKKFIKDNCIVRATGLAYSSLLALVPLAATIFSLMNGFGALEDIQIVIKDFIFEQLVPTRQDVFVEYVDQFLSNSTALGVYGLLLFAFMSIFLLDNIHNNFNAVFQSKSKSTLLRKFTSYTSTLFFGSLFLSLSFSVSRVMRNYFDTLGIEEINTLSNIFLKFTPTLSLFLFFLLMIIILPSTRVNFLSALVGAASGTLIWQLIRYWFLNVANTIIRMNVIYGSIAAIPIFLFWLQLAWLIVLISLEITYVFQFRHRYLNADAQKRHHPGFRATYAVNIYLRIAATFLEGDHKRLDKIIPNYNTYEIEIKKIAKLLVNSKLLTPVKDNVFLPSRNLNAITLYDIYHLFFINDTTSPATEIFDNLENIIQEHLNITVQDFLEKYETALD